MRTPENLTSRIAAWLFHAMLIAWLVSSLACGAKKGGDSEVLPGSPPKDAGAGTSPDAKVDAKVSDAAVLPPADVFVSTPSDAQPAVIDVAAPKPTVVSISVAPATTNIPPAGKVTLQVTGTNSDLTKIDVTVAATFTSSDPSIASVSANVVTGLSPGKATIVATYNGFVAFSNVMVGDATVVSISLSPSSVSAYSGSANASPVTAQALMSDGSHKDVTSLVTWTSSDPTVAAVSGSGYVQGLNPGSAKITATLGQIQATAAVQVYGQSLKHVTVRARPPVARPGDFVNIEVLAFFDSGYSYSITQSATLESSNTAVLKLSNSGNGIAMSVGKTIVTAKLGDQTVGSVEVVVTNATVDRLELSPAKLSLDFPNHGHFTAFAVYSDQSRYDISSLVSWSIDDGNIANFDQNDGVLVPYNLGTTKVWAYYDSFMASADVTVAMGSPISLEIGTDPVSVPNFGTFSEYANLNYADGSVLDVTGSATWITDDATIASLVTLPDYPGTFLAKQAGSTKIRAKVGSMTSGDVSVTVLSVALLAIDLSDSHLYMFPSSTEDVTANGTFQDGSQADLTLSVTWKTGNTAIAIVSNDPSSMGRVTGVSKGTTSLTATLGSVAVTTTITVN